MTHSSLRCEVIGMSNLARDVDGIRGRADADRPSPAIPLLLLGLVVTGVLVLGLIRPASAQIPVVDPTAITILGTVVSGPAGSPPPGSMVMVDGSAFFPFDD